MLLSEIKPPQKMFKDFNARFGVSNTLEEERQLFVNRSISFIEDFCTKVLGKGQRDSDYINLFNTVCFLFGKNPKDYTANFLGGRRIPDLEEISGTDFLSVMKLITAFRSYYSLNEKIYSIIDENILKFIDISSIDLQIGYTDGQFYPADEKLLDKELVEFSLKALSLYPNERKNFEIALNNFTANNKYGIIEHCYICMEGLLRKVLNNNKTLIENKPSLQEKISLSDYWKKIIFNYIQFGNDYGRHAAANRHQLMEAEAESYLYLTALLIRLVVKEAHD